MILETKNLGLRMFWRGDWEARVGPVTLTILYNGHGDGGVFLRVGERERHLRWPRNAAGSLTSGHDGLSAT